MAAEDRMSAPSALALLVIVALSTSCTAWHTMSTWCRRSYYWEPLAVL
jgi:hypothetical protein